MGEFRVHGSGALAFLQGMTPNNVAKLIPGRAHYSGLLNEQGTYIDDLLIYCLAEGDYLLVVNASNIGKDWRWLEEHAHPDCTLEDQSEEYALLALQGPAALGILQPLTATELAPIRYYGFVQGEVAGVPAILSRTGYTGEEGFELYLPAGEAAEVWAALLRAGADAGVQPAGLGARDTLRLEAGMALYGHEIDATTTPYQAGLGWVVKLKKGDFLGRDVLVAEKRSGPSRRLVGFEIQGRGIARQGHGILVAGAEVAKVASGTWSPTLEKAIGTALLPAELAADGQEVLIEVRRRQLPARIVPLPFYRRPEGV
jgi:aminomethyltransferase